MIAAPAIHQTIATLRLLHPEEPPQECDVNWLRKLIQPAPDPQTARLLALVETYESRLHAIECRNRDLLARVAVLEAEHHQLLAPAPEPTSHE